MDKGGWEEFADLNGGLTAYVHKSVVIWIPPGPDIDIRSRPTRTMMARFRGSLKKPLPPGQLHLRQGFRENAARVGGLDSWLFKRSRPSCTECIIFPWPKDCPRDRGLLPSCLRKAGWKQVKDTTRVVNDFIQLADATPAKIKEFVLKWGPLWLCSKHLGCFYGDHNHEDCHWRPTEPIDTFRALAKEVRTVFDIVVKINDIVAQGKEWEPTTLKQLGFPKEDKLIGGLRMGQWILTQIIKGYIRGVSFNIEWNNQKPELIIATGLGFLRVAWLMVAQNLTDSKRIFTCDSCRKIYPRNGKAPQGKRKNFCPECRVNGRGSKKLYARSKRARHTNKSSVGMLV